MTTVDEFKKMSAQIEWNRLKLSIERMQARIAELEKYAAENSVTFAAMSKDEIKEIEKAGRFR
jgi:hypothetical protein